MKKILFVFIACLMVFGSAACKSAEKNSYQIEPLNGTALHYSNKDNWMVFTGKNGAVNKVDLFYLYPTCVSPDCKTVVGSVDKYMMHRAHFAYACGAECMARYTNVFAPYYRQISGVGIMQAQGSNENLERLCRENVTRTDVYAALDYYFENENNGRPFILAGHSQGSCLLKIVLSEYMRLHPEYLKRMVACYAIGYCFPDSWFAANPHIKKAQGETDTGVLISWNSEGPNATKPNFCIGNGSFNINPLNWKTDETPAGIELNRGSITVDPDSLNKVITSGEVGARIDLKRGALICEGNTKCLPANPLFGDKSFHVKDWSFFYRNIQINAKKRIDAYFGKKD